MTFTAVLQAIGQGFTKGLKWAVEYAVPVEKLAALFFPTAAPELTVIADATTLLQNAVIVVEQKYAASGIQSGTGPEKLAEVLLLAGPAATSLLASAGVTASPAFLQKLISAIVAILNVQNISSGAAPAKA